MATDGCVEVLSLDTIFYLANCNNKSAKSRPSPFQKKKQKKLRIATNLMEIVMTITVAVFNKTFWQTKLIVV